MSGQGNQHVVLSLFHDVVELIVHGLLFAEILCFLFRPRASEYFRSRDVNGVDRVD